MAVNSNANSNSNRGGWLINKLWWKDKCINRGYKEEPDPSRGGLGSPWEIGVEVNIFKVGLELAQHTRPASVPCAWALCLELFRFSALPTSSPPSRFCQNVPSSHGASWTTYLKKVLFPDLAQHFVSFTALEDTGHVFHVPRTDTVSGTQQVFLRFIEWKMRWEGEF